MPEPEPDDQADSRLTDATPRERRPAPDLSVAIAGVRLPNPLVLASGILGTHVSLMIRAAESGAGAITAKSAGEAPRRGHPNPTCIDVGGGLLNAIGLANPGAAVEAAMLAEAKAGLARIGVPLIASVFGDSPEGFARAAEAIVSPGRAQGVQVDLLELNVSCPNVGSEFGEPFAADPEAAAAVTRAVRSACGVPIIVKLAPNVPSIGRVAAAVVDAGADAICAINTAPGMAIDVESGRPVLANRSGGLSGPALKPIAVHAVYEVARSVSVPIIGTGGVTDARDALEMMMAGATAVGIGSAVYSGGVGVFSEILRGMSAWLAERGLELADVRGRAHRAPELVWPEPATPPPVPHGGGSVSA